MVWNLDPVAFSFLGLSIRWYGIAYVAGFFLALKAGLWVHKKITDKNTEEDKKEFENLVFGVFLAGVIGGRLGFFLFYSWETFFEDPTEILRIWHGGMSIHGGVIFATLYLAYYAKTRGRNFLEITDTFVLPLSLALVFGRLANFVNGELVGRVTDVPWAVTFPHIDNQPRHPSQLYEMGKNIVNSVVLLTLLSEGKGKQTGLLSAVFLIGYGIMRFIIEFYRRPEVLVGPLTMGQFLCALMIAGGITIICFKRKEWRALSFQ